MSGCEARVAACVIRVDLMPYEPEDYVGEVKWLTNSEVANATKLLQGKWVIDILWVMRDRPIRLSELKRQIPTASKKALTARLRQLEAARIVQRHDLSNSVLHVEYSVAEAVRKPLLALLDCLAEWNKVIM